MHAPFDHDPGSPPPTRPADLAGAAPVAPARPPRGPSWLTCASRPAGAAAALAPVHAALYPALLRRLLAGAIDVVLCAWFFILAVALVHLSAPGARLHMEDMAVRAGALTAVMFLLYFFATESSPAQASVGKRLLGMKVMDRDGHAPGFERGALRFALTLGGVASGGLLFLGALRSRQGRCLQDRLTGTLVVMRDALPGQVRLHHRVPQARDDRWSLAACAALLLLATQVLWPWGRDEAVAMRVDRSVLAAREVGDALARHLALHGSAPDDLRTLGVGLALEDGDATVERLQSDGTFDLRLHFAPVDGLRLRMQPRRAAGGAPGAHKCAAIDLPPALTPGRCSDAPSP